MKRIQSILMSWLCSAMNWNFELFLESSLDGSWRQRIGFWIEEVLSSIFGVLYTGSNEELRDAEDIPAKYRSLRQRDHVLGYPEIEYPSPCATFLVFAKDFLIWLTLFLGAYLALICF